MREIILSNKEILSRLERVERTIAQYDAQIIVILDNMRQMEAVKQSGKDFAKRKRIGFKN